MSFKPERTSIAIAVILVLVVGQVYIGISFAEASSVVLGESMAMTQPQTLGILTTEGNKEITVNGTNSISGATIVNGATLETPTGVSATVSVGSRGSLEIEPNTKLTVQFDQSGLKVMLTEGCVNLRTKQGTTGEISTPKGSYGKTDAAQDGKLEMCPRRSASSNAVAAAGQAGLFELGTAAGVAIIVRGASAVAVPVAPRGVLY
jgi:hypothetical protein